MKSTTIKKVVTAYSRMAEPRRTQEYLADPLKIVAVPVTTQRCFFYFKHTDDYLDRGSRLVRAEQRVTRKVARTWAKMESSRNVVTVRVVGWVNVLLAQVPWRERSLASFPSESYILKRVHLQGKEETEKRLTLREAQACEAGVAAAPIVVYFPRSVISESVLNDELVRLLREGKQTHMRYLIYCLLALPLTIPIALVPLVPNIPGFYLAYRAYCNFKAYSGARHLESMMQGDMQPLRFADLQEYSALMADNVAPATPGESERMLLDQALLPRILDNLQIHELRRHIETAMRQEAMRLEEQAQHKAE
ncbi:ADR104Cp [Eremothecium gossypii ATCC 10895]|uniref:ADR104Cp n=1 Tax=Eremothecium gossypii (strain ATCC 10895 / CBS 109.51 / FGSC 9923 / NRRL Y-1056) TaxID=284811 RepID=Q75AH2_EREGS|nr:ADR104Cp [Eremothecium gossypii ATCC 10895]AAS52024.1 ADR104Cp [Eremothecium gossypii ATCC 10895]AEY96323.1 FADR104Cp [Eremothecium gossypii FDAG1]